MVLLTFCVPQTWVSAANKPLRAGRWRNEVPIPKSVALEENEDFLEVENRDIFIRFVKGMLQWRPEDRKTAEELLQDPWLNNP